MLRAEKPPFFADIQKKLHEYIRIKQRLTKKEKEEHHKKGYLSLLKANKLCWKY